MIRVARGVARSRDLLDDGWNIVNGIELAEPARLSSRPAKLSVLDGWRESSRTRTEAAD
jgi:hypothetical protein